MVAPFREFEKQEASCMSGIESVKKNAADAKIIEE